MVEAYMPICLGPSAQTTLMARLAFLRPHYDIRKHHYDDGAWLVESWARAILDGSFYSRDLPRRREEAEYPSGCGGRLSGTKNTLMAIVVDTSALIR